MQKTKRFRASLAAIALLGLLLAGGCGDDSDEGAAPSADTPVSTIAPAPDQGGALPDLPQNDDPAAVRCTGPPEGVFDATKIVGKPLADAERAAEAEGCSVREVRRDGEALAVTEDFRPDRVNVATEDDRVTEIVSLG